MGSFSDYLENKLLDHLMRKTTGAYTQPDIYVALGTAASDSSFTELANSGAYARVSTAASDWNAASSGSVSNANPIAFTTASADWNSGSNIGYFALYDSGTYGAGNMLAWGAITSPKPILSGDTASFAGGTPGDLVVSLD